MPGDISSNPGEPYDISKDMIPETLLLTSIHTLCHLFFQHEINSNKKATHMQNTEFNERLT